MDEEATLSKSEANAFFRLIRSQANNKNCADCAKPSPIWASTSFGFFICTECAARHRDLGVQISKVKSTILDTWKVGELRRMHVSGNSNVPKLGKDSDIRAKYTNGMWYTREVDKAAVKSAAEEPGTSFIHNLEGRLKRNVEPQKVREKPMPRFGDRQVRPAKALAKDQGAPREERKADVDRAVAIKQNTLPSLRKTRSRSFKVEENGDTSKRLGFGTANASSSDEPSPQNK
jgi:ADP-ribosylation factor GTPase-activating protein 2/3